MELSEYFSRIFPSTAGQMYYPSRKNNGIFVCFCFSTAGSNYFTPKTGRMTSAFPTVLLPSMYNMVRYFWQIIRSAVLRCWINL